MRYNLFLDDERCYFDVKWVRLPLEPGWLTVRSYGEFVDTIETHGLPVFVAFDHDLADYHYKIGSMENESYTYDDGDLKKTFSYGPEKTGYDAARWLCDYCIYKGLKFPEYVVHSLNAVGAKRIEDYIQFCKTRGGML